MKMAGREANGSVLGDLAVSAASDAGNLVSLAGEHLGARVEGKTRKSARTRARILAAASEIIAERGTVEFQMAEVASRCNMSKGSLYYYFRDRDDIVEEIFSSDIDAFVARLEKTMDEAPSSSDALAAACMEFARSVHDGESVVAAVASDLVRGGSDLVPGMGERFGKITALVEQQVRRAQSEGAVRDGIDPAFVSSMLVGTFLFAAIARAGKPGEPFQLEPFAEELMSFVRHGISA